MFVDGGKPAEKMIALAKRKRLNSRFVSEIIAQQQEKRNVATSGTAAERIRLTRRECEIVELLRSGKTNDEIASSMYPSLSTVKNHIRNVYTKLGARNRAEAIVRIQELEL